MHVVQINHCVFRLFSMIEGYYTELAVQESSIITSCQHQPAWETFMQYRLPGQLEKIKVAKKLQSRPKLTTAIAGRSGPPKVRLIRQFVQSFQQRQFKKLNRKFISILQCPQRGYTILSNLRKVKVSSFVLPGIKEKLDRTPAIGQIPKEDIGI